MVLSVVGVLQSLRLPFVSCKVQPREHQHSFSPATKSNNAKHQLHTCILAGWTSMSWQAAADSQCTHAAAWPAGQVPSMNPSTHTMRASAATGLSAAPGTKSETFKNQDKRALAASSADIGKHDGVGSKVGAVRTLRCCSTLHRIPTTLLGANSPPRDRLGQCGTACRPPASTTRVFAAVHGYRIVRAGVSATSAKAAKKMRKGG
mmetsp:Transcript_43664/g.139109  ORF Transcript_43664/g.139109 Transcript_43664/m.139109 type:complete len:205 (-) Transcript_43664:513-1127(-)